MPADALWKFGSVPGMPSYESDTGALLVYDILLAQLDAMGELRFFSGYYGTACVLAPDGLTSLHHDPDAIWSWRPVIYRLTFDAAGEQTIERMGSQQELGWRKGLSEMMAVIHADGEWTQDQAVRRANALLRQHLNPQQLLELEAHRRFPVRGGKTRNLYEIQLGNGFQLVDRATRELCVSYCFHPDEWMPDADVALGTKLMLEDEELEPEVMTNARSTIYSLGSTATCAERYAADIEKELIP